MDSITKAMESLEQTVTSWGVTPEHMVIGLIIFILFLFILAIYCIIKYEQKNRKHRKTMKVGDECSISNGGYGFTSRITKELEDDNYIVEVKVNKNQIYPK